MKIKVWCDSGANAFSCRNEVVDLKEIGVSDDEWLAMSDDEKDEVMRPIAFDKLDWGYGEIE